MIDLTLLLDTSRAWTIISAIAPIQIIMIRQWLCDTFHGLLHASDFYNRIKNIFKILKWVKLLSLLLQYTTFFNNILFHGFTQTYRNRHWWNMRKYNTASHSKSKMYDFYLLLLILRNNKIWKYLKHNLVLLKTVDFGWDLIYGLTNTWFYFMPL